VTFNADSHASAHLRWSELSCHDAIGTPYPLDWREDRGCKLAVEFERIRAAVGQAIRITSAYRTPAHNRAQGGRPRSQHLQGRALDLACPHGLAFDTFRAAVLRAVGAEGSLVRYVCVYPAHGFIHVDIRAAAKLLVETVTT
jgi:uncharacterized protein YcbK (DUF882 family)